MIEGDEWYVNLLKKVGGGDYEAGFENLRHMGI
jgi:hypothetical protein